MQKEKIDHEMRKCNHTQERTYMYTVIINQLTIL